MMKKEKTQQIQQKPKKQPRQQTWAEQLEGRQIAKMIEMIWEKQAESKI